MSQHELRFAENGDAILMLKTPLPPEVLALDAEGQKAFCELLSHRLRLALNQELLREADRRAIEELMGRSRP